MTKMVFTKWEDLLKQHVHDLHLTVWNTFGFAKRTAARPGAKIAWI